MEFLRLHSSGTSQRRHGYQGTHERRTRDDYTRSQRETRGKRQQRPAEIITCHEALGKGPVPRSKEKNDEFVQSWLQQTQSRHSRPSVTSYEKEPVQLTEQFWFETHGNNHRKRSRPLLESPPPPDRAKHIEYRFEKRARHKTREDKYDYKARETKKRVLDQESREHTQKEATGGKRQSSRHRCSVSSNTRNAVGVANGEY